MIRDLEADRKYVWVCYGYDGLPAAVADTAIELSEMTGYTKNNIVSSWNKLKSGAIKYSRFHRVKVGIDL